jgi:uncharacterized protein (TIGR02466 family)
MQTKKKLDTQETRDAPRQTKENIYMKPQDAEKKKFEEVIEEPSAKLRMKTQVPLIHKAFERGFTTPFGPLIGKTMMSHDLVEYMKLGMEKTSEDFGHNLAGVIEDQQAFDGNTGIKVIDKLGKFIKEYHQKSTLASSVGIYQVEGEQKIVLVDGWFVSQVAGEYNPMHSHPGCLFSCVGYLEIPKQIAEPEDEWSSDGCIEFSYGTPTSFSNTSTMFRPQVGDFYIFPAWLNHTVYPFKGDGRRRSFSINLIMTIEST